jgi:glycosyltransferase involved in cell wall biosynthesis
MKIFVLGSEGTGWSIDKDRKHVSMLLRKAGYSLTANIFTAKVIYSVWWNKLTNPFYYLLKIFGKKIVATISNDLCHQVDLVKKVIRIADHFVCANTKQRQTLVSLGVDKADITLLPFFVDPKSFKKLANDKSILFAQLGIDVDKVEGKVILGSFQRDTIGNGLAGPKWQKDPDLLIATMKKLKREKFILLLAGPRRHYIVNRCREENIDYLFLGNESYIDRMEDDLLINNLSTEKINVLYNLIDVYLVSSKSEGGPKAVVESVLCGCDILSTDVGFASDLLNSGCIYTNENDLVEVLQSGDYQGLSKLSFEHISDVMNEDTYSSQLDSIIQKVLS